jgi:hypothetical protein
MPQGAPAQAPQPSQGKQPSPEQIVSVVGEGLLALGQLLEGQPKLQDKVAGLIQGLQEIVQMAQGGAPEGPQGPAQMEQGGNPNAKPV